MIDAEDIDRLRVQSQLDRNRAERVVVWNRVLIIVIVVLMVCAFSYWPSRTIEPVEDSTTELSYIKHHWIGADEKIMLRALPDPDFTNNTVWMAKSKDGHWYPVFQFVDQDGNR